MHIGVDFDNTIACYDELFHKVAREQGLIPADVPVNKSEVRNYLRRMGNEAAWTAMQGTVYGARMSDVSPYPGVREFFSVCRQAGVRISIISHKTKHPFVGERHDLHAAATRWLEQQGFFETSKIGLSPEDVFFALTKRDKLDLIGKCGCSHFIDDLPEFLAETDFPKSALRILFDPNDLYTAEKNFIRTNSWEEIHTLFATEFNAANELGTLRKKIRPLLQAHTRGGMFLLQSLLGGANNRVYRVRSEKGDFALKVYFKNPSDPRDRFRAECEFYNFLWRQGIRRTPEPLEWDRENGFGLFRFVAGRKLLAEEVNAGAIEQAAEFLLEINRARTLPEAKTVPIASEACFSVAAHLASVQRRLERLATIPTITELDREAKTFVSDELYPAWDQVRASIASVYSDALENSLPESARCLSPSDFGFHNALLAADGRLCFFDFEYAGWDDPAKLICDFFCQPQLPVKKAHWEQFTTALGNGLDLGKALMERAQLLLPAYRIKWCCIMLNEFTGIDRVRREFAKGAVYMNERQMIQLKKARQTLSDP